MRKRHLITIAVLAAAAAVMLYDAVFNRYPPTVPIDDPLNLPTAPTARYECRNDRAWLIYTSSDGEQLPPVPMDAPCAAHAVPRPEQ
jgi:hypothetical protein